MSPAASLDLLMIESHYAQEKQNRALNKNPIELSRHSLKLTKILKSHRNTELIDTQNRLVAARGGVCGGGGQNG